MRVKLMKMSKYNIIQKHIEKQKSKRAGIKNKVTIQYIQYNKLMANDTLKGK